MARFFAFFTLFHLSLTFFDRRFPLNKRSQGSLRSRHLTKKFAWVAGIIAMTHFQRLQANFNVDTLETDSRIDVDHI